MKKKEQLEQKLLQAHPLELLLKESDRVIKPATARQNQTEPELPAARHNQENNHH